MGLRGERAGGGPPAAPSPVAHIWTPGRQRRGEASGHQLPTAAAGMAGGKEGLLQPPEAPSLARDGRRPQTQRFPHPAFRIPDMCLLGPSASLGASQASSTAQGLPSSLGAPLSAGEGSIADLGFLHSTSQGPLRRQESLLYKSFSLSTAISTCLLLSIFWS